MLSGFLEAPPPLALVKAWLCEFYGCLPSQLAAEPADELLQFWQLSNSFKAGIAKRPTSKARR